MIPRVTLYCELYHFWGGIFYRGVGTGFISSYKNQKAILERSGIFVTEDLSIPTTIFQANSHGPYTWYLASKYRRAGKKVIFYAHSTAEDLEKQFRVFHFFVPVMRAYLSSLYNFADAVICPSLYTANLLNTKYQVPKNKTIYISNGVDVHKFSFDEIKRVESRMARNISPDEVAVNNVAMVLKRKGTDTFVNIGKVFPQLKFGWFGKVFNVIFAPKVPPTTPNVKFYGYVPDIMEAYQAADIFFFPSYEEQQGISVLEAGAMNLPILIRDIPVYEGWMIDGENCLKARNEKEFKEKLSLLIADKTLRNKLGASLHELVVREHSFEAVGEKLFTLYNELLKA